jgi:hypothetical protein
VFRICPFAQGGLDKPFGFAVGLGRVGFGAAVFDGQILTGMAEEPGAVATALIGQQSAQPPTATPITLLFCMKYKFIDSFLTPLRTALAGRLTI